jgi:hypothetical protein
VAVFKDSGVTSAESQTIDSNFPKQLYLVQNYPNPFNSSTSIEYSIREASPVQLRVYDILGNEVATLINEKQSAGSYHVNFTGTDLTNGVYFYKLQSGSFTETKKMNLIR